MAQHILLSEEREPKVFKSIKRIVNYVNRFWDYRRPNDRDYVYRKEIVKLPKEYSQTGRALAIKSYNLQDKVWDQRQDGGYDLRKNASLEVHFTKKGEVTAVYYPV